MIDRRIDHTTRKRVSQMSRDEMRRVLLTSEKTGLPNRRAYDERGTCPFVAMADVNGLKRLNDNLGYAAGDALICRFAQVLVFVGLDAYHEKGDEFLCRGSSYLELKRKLTRAQSLMRRHSFDVCALEGQTVRVESADFCFGIGTTQAEAEKALKYQKRVNGGRRAGNSCLLEGRRAEPARSNLSS